MENELSPRDRGLLSCGMAVAPVFYAVAIGQLPSRPDFHIDRMPLSYLAVGAAGWIQRLDFLATGVLALLCAVGLRAALRGKRTGLVTALLVGVFGAAMAAAGVFGPDPLPGSQNGGATMTPTGAAHMAAFMVAFLALVAGCGVSAWRFAKQRKPGWAIYCLVSALLTPVLIGSSAANPAIAGILVASAGLVLFACLGAIAFETRASIKPTSAEPSYATVSS